MLKFQIQGSGKDPYVVTAEGHGETFKMFCSCPAGRRGGMFCKHCQALLLGDVSNLVGSADDLPELLRMVQGSHLSDKAMTHKPVDSPDRWAHIQTLEDVVSEFGGKLTAKGYVGDYAGPRRLASPPALRVVESV